MSAAVYEATTSAPVNIACIKYWGKRDTKLILPTNSSLSVTLDQDLLRSTTTSRADPSFTKDRLWLNGKEEEIKDGGRMDNCIKEMKRLRKVLVEDKDPNAPKLSEWKLHIVSFNTVPTAAGLASSASGFAALTTSLASLFSLPLNPSELSLIARRGSGSACRSLFGGYVAWEMGSKPDGSDSLAVEVAPQSHWPEMRAVVCVVSGEKKDVGSSVGMQLTVETSPLLQHRIKYVVPERMEKISKAIKERNFDEFAKITMADSNQFHAVALDTTPPIFYMNDVSRNLIALVEEYNRVCLEKTGHLGAAYTFDAGPNAVIYTLPEHIKAITELVLYFFPVPSAPAERSTQASAVGFTDVLNIFPEVGGKPTGKLIQGFNEEKVKKWDVGAVKGVIHCKVGDGPKVLGKEASLMTAEGTPKPL
ncbi:hypothetical protein GLOTRDRAFT_127445 [Gloeophyllum trabeum ATCC 11539]|uniref:Diphosphomevalonate decarboxylase n=1 Tax=Gloeophyllum trabeum (strain ATCC 11539 / FP-39264 / Madison 617) TaxID=670483 RepID=S7QE36_GLOTA|nr:uncharacterized protein GLOTRDRAFT_127445 [Gloeophyllum trabeum ATCC 11539]EPQ57677.1 hypothetical protein GLOTRDRAFT_127445 [Gloeophyllum trabeum ATCC 11539]